jgi:hypothetical protein
MIKSIYETKKEIGYIFIFFHIAHLKDTQNLEF